MGLKQFKNLKQLITAFPDERSCRDHFETLRWNGNVTCPHCGAGRYYRFASKKGDRNNRYKCADPKCRKKFNCLSGTVFENTKVGMFDWFKVIYIFTSHKKGISSVQLGKDMGVTQKTAWFMLHRLREMMREKAVIVLSGHVEADETYVGGKEKNKHKHKRTEGNQGRSTKTKTAVFGLLERGGRIVVRQLDEASGAAVLPIIEEMVQRGSVVSTDEWRGYDKVRKKFAHEKVKHVRGEYVKGSAHTNGVENFWSHLKRGIHGIYHWVSRKHLWRYCDEFAFRFNTRKLNEYDRFNEALTQAGSRLTYDVLKMV